MQWLGLRPAGLMLHPKGVMAQKPPPRIFWPGSGAHAHFSRENGDLVPAECPPFELFLPILGRRAITPRILAVRACLSAARERCGVIRGTFLPSQRPALKEGPWQVWNGGRFLRARQARSAQ
jgi:hypothetical protein